MTSENLPLIGKVIGANTAELAVAQNHLVSSIIGFLIVKGIINHDEYLEYNTKMQDRLLEMISEREDCNEEEKQMKQDYLKAIFELHRDKLFK